MVENQAYLFLIFSLTGVIIGILFDIFRVLRKNFKTANIITYIEDVAFWILTGTLILYNIWYFNDGEIRFFMFLGIIMGILIYILTLSNLFIEINSKILTILKKIIGTILVIFRPILSIFNKLSIIINKLFKNFVKEITKLVNFKIKRGNLEKNGE